MGWGIALHGGAGDISKDLPRARKEAVEACLAQCLRLGVSALESSHAALDVAELVVIYFTNLKLLILKQCFCDAFLSGILIFWLLGFSGQRGFYGAFYLGFFLG